MEFYFLLTATLVLAVLTFLPVLRFEAWWIRLWDFPRVQLAVFIVVLLIVQLTRLDLSEPDSWGLVVIAVACLANQAWWILPYSPFFRKEVVNAKGKRGEALAVMTANVLTSNRNAPALVTLVRQHRPDILVTLESDQWWEEQLRELESDYPHTIKCPLDNLYGMHVYSHLPLQDAEIRFMVEDDVPSMHAKAVLASGRQVQVHFLHPAPPSPTENDESTERDAELVLVAREVADESGPIIVTGDLNDVAWSETTRLFRKISGLLDPRVGRGMFNSFHAEHWLIRWPLDHVFHSHHFTFGSMRRLPAFGSDHFAILTTLVLEPSSQDEEDGLSADKDDRELADEKLAQANTD